MILYVGGERQIADLGPLGGRMSPALRPPAVRWTGSWTPGHALPMAEDARTANGEFFYQARI